MNNKEKVPKHVAIIMDGNRRWAKKRGLPTFVGHKRGYNKFREIGEICLKRGVKILTVYAFSTENWNRSKEEVSYLMDLLKEAVTKHAEELNKKDIKLQVLGRLSRLPKGLQDSIQRATELTKNNKKGILNIALNYGGHIEIVDAIKRIIKDRVSVGELDEKKIENYLYTSVLPPVDLLIRTGGEQRISNFLLWQIAYAELYFTNTYWPEFGEKDLDKALLDFTARERRMGK